MVTSIDTDPDLSAEMASVKSSLARGDIEGARSRLAELGSRWPESDRIRRLACAIAPPTVKVSDRGTMRDVKHDHGWLKAHAGEYRGQWLAVLNGKLLVADPDLGIVLARLKATAGAERAILHFEPPGADPVRPRS